MSSFPDAKVTKETLGSANKALEGLSPESIVRDVLAQAERPILTTSFGAHAAVLLDVVTKVQPDIPVVWVDHGFNTNATYRFARKLIDKFSLNMKIYAPVQTPAWITATLGGVPDIADPAHAEFTRRVKLEPFARALSELAPDVWLTGIRAEETELRASLDTLSYDGRGILKVAPLLRLREAQLDSYLAEHDLPSEANYFDPTKGIEGRECGLHQREAATAA
jgi:phosphoadenosine phosphosulfate reductase